MFTENKIYRSGNYIILEIIGDTIPFEYAINKTVYTRQETPTDVFIISESGVDRTAAGRKQILLSDVIAGAWKDEGGTAYDETTLTTFFRENTGFNPTSGGSGVGVNSVTGDGVGGTAADVVLTFPDADQVDDATTDNKFVRKLYVNLDSAESSVSRTVSGGRTFFTITHNFATTDIYDRIYRLSDGRRLNWRVETTTNNDLQVSRAGTVADGIFRILIHT